jgi:hypothetical protein
MTTSNIPNRVQILKDKFTVSVGLPFRELLPEATIQAALNALEIQYRRRLFDPFVTLWAFLSQVLDKEIYVYLLAYNLLRTLMWEAGTAYGVLPLRLSLQGTRQHLDNFIPQLLATSGNKRRRIYRILLVMIVHKPVPQRPGRSEPRVLSSSP